MNLVLYAVPVFFLFMGLELCLARIRGRDIYRANDAVGSLSLGVLSQVSGLLTPALTIGIYASASRLARFSLPPESPLVWIASLLSYDFCYYWNHRLDHEVGILWAAHVVHHQSERFNLTTALRQSGTSQLLSWIFYLPLALAGVPVGVFVVVAAIHLIYQFWIHTELVGPLRVLDRVLATPSNHRVHHAVNDRYVDRNYGGILMLWDRLFGTFEPEDPTEPCVFGTRKPLRSFSPLWANLEVYAALASDAIRTGSWRDRIRVWLARPGWRPADVAASDPWPPFDLARERFDPPLVPFTRAYGLVQLALLILLAVFLLVHAADLGDGARVALALYLVLSLTLVGRALEGRGAGLDIARVLLTALLVLVTGHFFGAEEHAPPLVLTAVLILSTLPMLGAIGQRRLTT
jgi:alkylglycerol monooxygenase